MDNFTSPYIYFFAGNLIFIFSALFGAYIRKVHTCPEFSTNPQMLYLHYPARKLLIVIGLLMALEFPYLINVSSFDTLLFVRTYSILSYPIFIILLFERYFFYSRFSVRYLLSIIVPAALFGIPLFYYALLGGERLRGYDVPILCIALALGLCVFAGGCGIPISNIPECERGMNSNSLIRPIFLRV